MDSQLAYVSACLDIHREVVDQLGTTFFPLSSSLFLLPKIALHKLFIEDSKHNLRIINKDHSSCRLLPLTDLKGVYIDLLDALDKGRSVITLPSSVADHFKNTYTVSITQSDFLYETDCFLSLPGKRNQTVRRYLRRAAETHTLEFIDQENAKELLEVNSQWYIGAKDMYASLGTIVSVDLIDSTFSKHPDGKVVTIMARR